MTVNIGIFQREEQVVEAIRLLREAGIDHDDIRVVVKNAESAPLISANTDVPVEDLTGIEEARGEEAGVPGVLPIGVAGMPGGSFGTVTGSGYSAGFVIGAFDLDRDHGDREKVLRDVGIPDHASGRCEEEVGAGRYLVLADAGDDTNATTILRHAGAEDVLH